MVFFVGWIHNPSMLFSASPLLSSSTKVDHHFYLLLLAVLLLILFLLQLLILFACFSGGNLNKIHFSRERISLSLQI